MKWMSSATLSHRTNGQLAFYASEASALEFYKMHMEINFGDIQPQ